MRDKGRRNSVCLDPHHSSVATMIVGAWMGEAVSGPPNQMVTRSIPEMTAAEKKAQDRSQIE